MSDVLATSSTDVAPVSLGTNLGGFQVVKVQNSKDEMENTLNELRRHYMVDAGSHVYHTSSNTTPIVPTGKITLRFTPDSSSEQRQEILQENHLEIIDSKIKRRPDGTKVETYTVRTTPEADNPLKVAEKLQRATDVIALVEPDLATPGRLFAFQLPSDVLLKEQWHLKNDGMQFGTSLGLQAGADARVVAAWHRAQSLGSSACIVAVIDDGFDLTHPDLSGNSKVLAPWDFTTNTDNPAPRRFHPDPRRGDYHGTACAGVAIGNANSTGIIGAAPNCRFMPVRWHDAISDDTIEQQFAYLAAQGAWVVSCSWGVAAEEFYLSTVMDEAITDCATLGLDGLGCVIVFAAGNSNHDINDPDGGTVDGFAIHPDVIAVAACNSRDEKSNYSNFGREISICAPSSGTGGRGILTSDVRGSFQFQGQTFEAGYEAGDYTRTFGGTSSAAPLVAGICALMLSANPGLTAKQVKEIIQRTARQICDPDSYVNGHSIHFGYGCINADAAVQAALQASALKNTTRRTTPTFTGEELIRRNTSLYASEFWGISRHELIAGAAAELLGPPARRRVAALLARLGNNVTLRDIAGWADQIKGLRPGPGQDPDTREFLEQFPDDASRDWHYVNLPLGVSGYDDAEALGFTRHDDVVQMIIRCVGVLSGNLSIMSELNALRWPVHLVGDVHQPIHVGCGFVDDSSNTPRLGHVLEEYSHEIKVYTVETDVKFFKKLLRAQRSLLYSLREHIDDCYSVFKTLVDPAHITKKIVFTDKYLQAAKFKELDKFNKAIQSYKQDYLSPLVNSLKHSHARLQGFYCHGPSHIRLGYYLEEMGQDTVVGPSTRVHKDGNLAFSFSRDLTLNLFNVYYISEQLVHSVQHFLKETYNFELLPSKQNDYDEIKEVIENAATLQQRFFQDELLKPCATISVESDSHDSRCVLSYPTTPVEHSFPSGLRMACFMYPDSRSKKFKLPYTGSRMV